MGAISVNGPLFAVLVQIILSRPSPRCQLCQIEWQRPQLLPGRSENGMPIAGARNGAPGSPMPVGAASEATMCTSTLGISNMRVGS